MRDEEHLARLVHGAACVGAPVESLLRASHGRRQVVLRAMAFVDPMIDMGIDGPLPWNEVLGLLQATLERCVRD